MVHVTLDSPSGSSKCLVRQVSPETPSTSLATCLLCLHELLPNLPFRLPRVKFADELYELWDALFFWTALFWILCAQWAPHLYLFFFLSPIIDTDEFHSRLKTKKVIVHTQNQYVWESKKHKTPTSLQIYILIFQ